MKKGVMAILTTLAGGAAGAGAATRVWKKKYDEAGDVFHKMLEFYNIQNQWLILKQEGKSLAEFFKRNEYRTVAIYGMKELGERLYDELKDTEIKVEYAIDKNADQIYAEVDVVSPDDELKQVDVIVVTAPHYFDEIEEMLAEKVDYPVVSIEDVIYEL